MTLAGKLDQSLRRQFPGAAPAADFHACIEAGARLELPTVRPSQG